MSFGRNASAAVRQARAPWALLLLGPIVGFFGTGYFSGFGAITAELFPTRIRVTAQGFTYNSGRVASAIFTSEKPNTAYISLISRISRSTSPTI